MSHYYIPTKGSKRHALSRYLLDIALYPLRYIGIYKEPLPNKILLICNGHIGDTIMSTSIFREIKKVYPESKITVLISNISKQILEKNPYIDNIISSKVFWQKEHRNFATFKEWLKLIGQLRKEKMQLKKE